MNLRFKIIDFFRKTDAVTTYKQIIESQWLSSNQLLELQFNNLKKLLIHSFENVPFYKKRFLDNKFDPYGFSQFSDLNKLPILTKDDVRENFESIKALDFVKFSPRKTQTGGSTGKPFVTYKDKISHSYLWANVLRAWNVAGYNLGDRYIQIATGSLLPNTSSIKNKIYNYLQNSLLIPSYHLNEKNLTEIIELINNSKGKFIYGYSSTISLIARYSKRKNLPIKRRLDAIFTTSDMLYPNQREEIEDLFNSKIYDMYGCPEGGIISFECKRHSGYHLNQESVYVSIENKDESGTGNIISTPLHNYAFPLIKYNTGDIGKLSEEKCNCSRELFRITELGGRVRDFIVLEDGRHIHGAFFNHLEALYNKQWISQYQIIQEKLNEITVKISCVSEPNDSDLKQISDSLHKGLLPNIKINFDFSGVKYTKVGKFRLVISNVSNTWENN